MHSLHVSIISLLLILIASFACFWCNMKFTPPIHYLKDILNFVIAVVTVIAVCVSLGLIGGPAVTLGL